MRWVGEEACKRERRSALEVLVGRPEERNNLQDTGRNGRIILKWILMKWDGDMDWIECATEPSGSIKGGEIFDWLRTC